MVKNKKQTDASAEVKAIGEVHSALKELQPPAQLRVLRYCAEMLGVVLDVGSINIGGPSANNEPYQELDLLLQALQRERLIRRPKKTLTE